MTAPSETQKLCTHNVPLSEQCDKCNAGGNGRYGIHIAPSETPLTDAAIVSAEFIRREMDYYSHKFVLADVARSLEIALAESRAECERLREQSDCLNTLNIGQIKIIADLQHQLRESESREREAYERAAKVCDEYAANKFEHQIARGAACDLKEKIRTLGERRER